MCVTLCTIDDVTSNDAHCCSDRPHSDVCDVIIDDAQHEMSMMSTMMMMMMMMMKRRRMIVSVMIRSTRS